MDPFLFQAIVDKTVSELPPQFREALKEVAIVVRALPSREQANGRGILLGLYEGIPLTQWGRDFNGKPPDVISLFQENIERVAQSEEELPKLIRETLLHEIAHYFGFDHPEIHKMEKRWREKRT